MSDERLRALRAQRLASIERMLQVLVSERALIADRLRTAQPPHDARFRAGLRTLDDLIANYTAERDDLRARDQPPPGTTQQP